MAGRYRRLDQLIERREHLAKALAQVLRLADNPSQSIEVSMTNTIIARRELELLHQTGSTSSVVVTVSAPEEFPEGRGFFCSYEISGLASTKHLRVGGADEMQALILALKLVGHELMNSTEGKAGRLRWLGETDLGFAMT